MITMSPGDISSCSDVSDSYSDDTNASPGAGSNGSSTTGNGLQNGKMAKSDDICRDYLRNVCKRGQRCKYRHPTSHEAKQVLGQLTEYTFCHDFQNSGCRRPNCKFIHCTREEEEYYKQTSQLPVRLQQAAALGIGVLPKTLPILRGEVPICKDYLKGECKRGGRCKFRHLTVGQYDTEVKRTDQPLIGNTAPVVSPVTTPQQAVVVAADSPVAAAANMAAAAAAHAHAQVVAAAAGHMTTAPPPQPQTVVGAPQTTAFHSIETPQSVATHVGMNAGNAYELAVKRRRLELVAAAPTAAGFNNNNAAIFQNGGLALALPTEYSCHESDFLKRKIEQLKKQVTTLMATNDVLLEQNARFRHTSVNKLCNVTLTNAPPIVTVSQVVTPTITPAPAVARQPPQVPPPIVTTIGTPQQMAAQVAASQQITQGMSMLYEHCTKTAEIITLNHGQTLNQALNQSQLGPRPPTAHNGIGGPPPNHTQTLAPSSMTQQSVAIAPQATNVMVPVSMIDTSLAPPGTVSMIDTSLAPPPNVNALNTAVSMAHELHQRQQASLSAPRNSVTVNVANAMAQSSLPPSLSLTHMSQNIAQPQTSVNGPIATQLPQQTLVSVHNSCPLVSYPMISHAVSRLPGSLAVGVLQPTG